MSTLIKTGTQKPANSETARLRLALAFMAERLDGVLALLPEAQLRAALFVAADRIDAVLALVPEAARGEAAYVNAAKAAGAVKGKAAIGAAGETPAVAPVNGAAGSLPELPITPNDPSVIEATAEPTPDPTPTPTAPVIRRKPKREPDPIIATPAQANGTSTDAPVEDAAK